ncbi:MAG: hypothetical protein JXB24_07805 [Bacteroidales bacterium]|nr:hypothetical protein [Bacteroidales bacterium]
MKKSFIILLLIIQNMTLFCQKEYTSPDGEKKAVIEKATEKKFRVVVNSSPHKYYEQIVDQKVYFFTDSNSIVYIAKCDDGYCLVVDGIEQPHYKEIINNHITFSSDRSHYAYMGLIRRGLVMVEICYVIDGKEQPHYHNLSSNSIVFSPDNKHWAYAALLNNKWFYVIDGIKQPDYNLVSAINIIFSPDSKHWKYQAQKEHDWIYIIDGKETQEDIPALFAAKPSVNTTEVTRNNIAESTNDSPAESDSEKQQYLTVMPEDSEEHINNITPQKKKAQLNYKGNLFCIAFDPINFIFSGPTVTGELTLQGKGKYVGFGILSGYRCVKWGWMARDLLWDDLEVSSYTIPIAFRIYMNADDKADGGFIGPYTEFGKLRYNEGDNEYIRAFGLEYGFKYIWNSGLTIELSVIFGKLIYGTPDDWIKMWYPALSCKMGYTF